MSSRWIIGSAALLLVFAVAAVLLRWFERPGEITVKGPNDVFVIHFRH